MAVQQGNVQGESASEEFDEIFYIAQPNNILKNQILIFQNILNGTKNTLSIVHIGQSRTAFLNIGQFL